MRLGRIARISLILLAFAAVPAAAQTPPSCGGLPATLVGTDGNDQLRGTAGNDVIVGLGGNDVIRGEGGHDVICGGPGNDTLFGGPGNDRLIGGDGNDSIHAGEGDDFLDGAGGKNNTLHGDEGWDQCVNGKPHKCEDDGSGQNTAPVAHAGPDQTTPVNTTVTLDGTGSTDADGDAITYLWALTTAPAGSSAVLSDPAAARPTLVIDRPGTYVLQLVVSDGTLESEPDSVQIATTNSPPVAHAGAGQTARVGDTVTLNGGQSSDVDGDPITYRWTLLSAPDGSGATLAGATTVAPSFVVDRPGAYVAELIVNDGLVDSEADTVTVVTTNSAPVANAGPDQSAPVTATVTLDGSGSTDVDGDSLAYQWSLTNVPGGSLAALTNPTTVGPTFTIDRPGTYVAQLIVHDGTSASAADVVTVSTVNSAPVADAGDDNSVLVGATATLDGTGSSDTDGNPLSFQWSLLSVPAGSAAALSDATATQPSFFVDLPGQYVAQLVVNDGTANSAPDTVIISTANSAPVANAGADTSALVGATATLDGAGSTDVDGDPLTFQWALISAPAGSVAALSDPTAAQPSFVVDVPGQYVAQLVVNDGTVNSAADTVIVTTTNSMPVANAGADNSVLVGATATLDGTGSSDVDGDALSFQWALTSTPAGSAAALSDPTAAQPSFVVDLPGQYVAQLSVHDGMVNSAPDTVIVTTANSAPVANAGADRSAPLHQQVMLDGGASHDADFNPLTYRWSFTSKPAGSAATITDHTAALASFTPDVPGIYIAQLIVNDGTVDSAPDTATVTTVNTPPVANAGAAQTVEAGDTVTLAGSGSDVDGDQLTFAWTLITVPAGSAATLSNAASASPTFVADRSGEYVARLVVNDGHADSDAAFVTITATPQQIQVVVLGNALIGVGRSTQVQVTLPKPAAAPVTVTIGTQPAGLLTVAAPGTIAIPMGGTTGVIGVTGAAPGAVTISASAPDYADGSVGVTVTDKLVNLPDAFSVPLGQQVGLLVSISPQPAPPGGVVIQLTTSDESVIAVSASVTILPGQFSATAIVTGVRPGTAIVTATNPDFATDTAAVSTSAQLNITATGLTFAAGFTGNITVQLQSSGATVPAPSPGIAMTLTSANPQCAVPQNPSPTLATGLSTLTAVIAHGGTTTLPCTTTITAASPGVAPDTISVTVNPKPNIALTPDLPQTIGSGQMTVNLRAFLGVGAHGGATVTVASNNPGVLVSPNTSTVGTPSITVTVPNNSTQVNFIAHALEAFVGSATITVSEPRFNNGTGTVTVVQPAIALTLGHGTTLDSLDPNLNFTALIGVPAGNSVSSRNIRAGGQAVNVTVASSNPGIGNLVFGGVTAGSIVAPITPGSSQTATVQFHPIAAGQTTVSASAAGVISTPQASPSVTVTTPTISLTPDLPQTIGSGQMTVNLRAFLSAGNHGGATVTISSNNPGVLLSPNTSTVGTPSIQVTLPTNQIQVNFVAHAVEGFVGSATITASEPRFVSATGTVTVVQPVIQLNGLTTGLTIDTLDPSRQFNVLIGVPNGTGVSSRLLRAGSPGVTVTITSGTPAVGDLVAGSTTAATVTAAIPAGSNLSANVLFHPVAAGQTTVTIAAPGVITTPLGSATMIVTTPQITLNTDLPQTIGSGQMTVNLRAGLTASNHGGGIVTIASNNPNVLVSPNTGTIGTQSMQVNLALNQTQINFIAHALEGFVGSATITASEPRFTSAAGTVTVVQPVIQLNGLTTGLTIDTLDPNRQFNVLIGVPNANGVSSRLLRAGSPGVTVTLTSSTPTVGDLVSGSTTAASVTATIPAGSNLSSNVLFHPIAAGQTTVSITAPGVITTPLGSATVTVTTPTISLSSDLPATVGAGLQTSNRRAFLGASNHGGVVMRIESSNPAIALVAPNGSTAGTAFILVNVPNGQTQVNFVVQGVEGADGGVVITASTPGFSDAQNTATVVPAALAFSGLSATATAGGANDVFVVVTGIPDATGSALAQPQTVRGGGQMNVTITSSSPAVAGLVSGASTVPSLTMTIGANQQQTANVSLRPLTGGSTLVTATAPNGVITTTQAAVTVTVNP